jgi:hypothetical protein
MLLILELRERLLARASSDLPDQISTLVMETVEY